MKKLTIQLVVFNNDEQEYISYLFDSIKKQTFKDFDLLIVDNSEGKKILDVAKKQAEEAGFDYSVIDMKGNVGFARANNEAYRNAKTPYIMVLNPDMYLEKDALEKMVDFLDIHKDTASISTRLMRWDFERVKKEKSVESGFTKQIDAIGIRLLRNRRAVEWLAQYDWVEDSENPDIKKIYNKSIVEVFGVSGAMAMYRKTVVDEVLLDGGNLFDPTYHSYKEDLDLAYRLRNAGYTSYVLLDTVCYHDRTAAAPKGLKDFSAILNKGKQSEYVRFHSYKNHIRTLYKNEYWQNFVLDLPWIFWYELKKFIYLVFLHPMVIIKGWLEIIKKFSYTNKAKKDIHASRKMYWKGLRRWFR